MKFLTVMISMSMLMGSITPFNASASIGSAERYEMKVSSVEDKVNGVVDQFHYKMTVEWDQKDIEFKKQAEEDLKQNLLDLEASGVSLSEIQKTMEKKVVSGKLQEEYERFISAMKAQNLSEEELSAKTMEFMKKNYQEGVDFAGKGGSTSHRWKFITAVVVVVIIAYIVHEKHRDNEREEEQEEEDCECYGYECEYPNYPQVL